MGRARYVGYVQVNSVSHSELRLTLEATIRLSNLIHADPPDLDSIVAHTLITARFSRAEQATADSIARLIHRVRAVNPLIRSLPEISLGDAIAEVNASLSDLAISPSIIDHDGIGPHMHWTQPSDTFDDQIVADILMALAQELCDSGTSRFGICAAEGCSDRFYDTTRNRSRRFCEDPRCASRTHTARHRARQNRGTQPSRVQPNPAIADTAP